METAVHYLGLCAEKGNQYAQYVLGKLYLCGRDVSRDREKAVEYLTASAEQGNLYASFFTGTSGCISGSVLISGSNQTASSSGKAVFAKKHRDQWK